MFIHSYEFNNWHMATFESIKEKRPVLTKWCYEVFGPPGHQHLTHETRWKDGIQFGEIYFARKADLEWFILRWS